MNNFITVLRSNLLGYGFQPVMMQLSNMSISIIQVF